MDIGLLILAVIGLLFGLFLIIALLRTRADNEAKHRAFERTAKDIEQLLGKG